MGPLTPVFREPESQLEQGWVLARELVLQLEEPAAEGQPTRAIRKLIAIPAGSMPPKAHIPAPEQGPVPELAALRQR
jgi:hypothetical protein